MKCRRKFGKGDRVFIVNIIERTGINPSNPLQVGAWFSGEFEIAHVICADPSLDNSIIIGGT